MKDNEEPRGKNGEGTPSRSEKGREYEKEKRTHTRSLTDTRVSWIKDANMA